MDTDLTGKTFGRLTVLRLSHKSTRGDYWLCQCSCEAQTEKPVLKYLLLNGHVSSCGCLRRELRAAANTTHGQSHTSTYRVWKGMRARCNNPNNKSYEYYGGRGIKICERWETFENFLADVGEIPKGLTIDRRDNDSDYSPDNVRLVTHKEQMNNTSLNHVVEFRGESKTLAQWGEIFGISGSALSTRILRYKWPIEKALTTPVARKGG